MSTAVLFGNDRTIIGMGLLDFLQWAKESDAWLACKLPRPPAPRYGVLALPPLQRTAVWGPKQIVDLWDSALRGLPLGTLFLVPPHGERTIRGTGVDAENQVVNADGWDLLDGQQRTRALLLGVRGPLLIEKQQDKRCLWIDLEGKSQTHLFSIHLTSESQPSGYQQENGQKLPLNDRRKAREMIEPDLVDETPSFNYELFRGFINNTLAPGQPQPGWRPGWPPLPAKAASSRAVFPLLIDLSKNRSWNDQTFATKLDSIEDLNQMAFDQSAKENWRAAAGAETREWPSDRLVAFQRVIAERTAWLYERLYRDLRFDAWEGHFTEIPHVSPPSELSLTGES